MTRKQERHLAEVKRDFLRDVDQKYRVGAQEHGTNLVDDNGIEELLREAMAETVDQYTYLHAALKKIRNPQRSATFAGRHG